MGVFNFIYKFFKHISSLTTADYMQKIAKVNTQITHINEKRGLLLAFLHNQISFLISAKICSGVIPNSCNNSSGL